MNVSHRWGKATSGWLSYCDGDCLDSLGGLCEILIEERLVFILITLRTLLGQVFGRSGPENGLGGRDCSHWGQLVDMLLRGAGRRVLHD